MGPDPAATDAASPPAKPAATPATRPDTTGAARNARPGFSARAWSGPHPLLAAAGAGVLCGAALPAMRMALPEVAPIQLALLRYAIAALCLLAVLACAPGLRRQRVDWPAVALVDLGQFGVLAALLAFGLRFTSATRGGIVFACFPLLVLLLTAPAWRERPGARFWLGALLCLLGVGFALGDGSYVRPARYAWLGEAFVFLSAVLGAFCSLLIRPCMARLPALQAGAWAMGAAVLLLILLAGSGWSEGLRLSARGCVIVLYLGVSCAAAYVLWLYALAHAPAARVLPYLACVPLTASLLGAHSLHERQSIWLLAGLGCVVAGLVLALRNVPPLADGPEPAP